VIASMTGIGSGGTWRTTIAAPIVRTVPTRSAPAGMTVCHPFVIDGSHAVRLCTITGGSLSRGPSWMSRKQIVTSPMILSFSGSNGHLELTAR
jgi:hypothetical protein